MGPSPVVELTCSSPSSSWGALAHAEQPEALAWRRDQTLRPCTRADVSLEVETFGHWRVVDDMVERAFLSRQERADRHSADTAGPGCR